MNPWERYSSESAGPWGQYAQDAPAKKKPEAPINPMDGMPWYQQFNEGMGKGFVDMGRGLGNIVTDIAPSAASLGFSTRADTDAAKKRDAVLTDTGWGMTGDIAANILPALLMPASTIPRAAATGAALGFAQPVGTTDSRTGNAFQGGLFGAAVPAAIAGGKALYGTGRALLEPIFAPTTAATRLIDQFADDPAALRAAAQSAKELIPGSKPTLAEIAQQPGISSLQRSVMNQPGPMQSAMTQRYADQNTARLAALHSVGQDEGALQAAIAAREAAAGPGYEAAKNVMVKADDGLNSLLNRPSMKSAWARAVNLAKENGETLTVGVDAPATQATTGILDAAGNTLTKDIAAQTKDYSGRGLHYLKMALDDMMDGGAVSGIGKNEQRALTGTKDKLLGWMDTNIPEYASARATYAAKSQPINEMQFGQALIDKATPALSRAAGTEGNLQASAYGRALADAEGTVKRATGRDLTLDQVLSPDAKGKVFGVAQDLDRAAKSQALGKPTGSPTAQYLTTQNLMRQGLGPLGLPQSMTDKAAGMLMGTPGVGSVMGAVMKGPEQRVQQEVGNLLLNPSAYTAALARLNRPVAGNKRLMFEANPYLPAIAAGGLFGATNGRQ